MSLVERSAQRSKLNIRPPGMIFFQMSFCVEHQRARRLALKTQKKKKKDKGCGSENERRDGCARRRDDAKRSKAQDRLVFGAHTRCRRAASAERRPGGAARRRSSCARAGGAEQNWRKGMCGRCLIWLCGRPAVQRKRGRRARRGGATRLIRSARASSWWSVGTRRTGWWRQCQ